VRAKLLAEGRIELRISRLSIECFEPTKLLRNGAEKRNRTADLPRTEQALFQLSYSGLEFGADDRTRTCDDLLVGHAIWPLIYVRMERVVRLERSEWKGRAARSVSSYSSNKSCQKFSIIQALLAVVYSRKARRWPSGDGIAYVS
jgi:hypothetical protein